MVPWYMVANEVSSMCIAQLLSPVCGGEGTRLISIFVWSIAGGCVVMSVMYVYKVCNFFWMH